jgi:hypothetical protein
MKLSPFEARQLLHAECARRGIIWGECGRRPRPIRMDPAVVDAMRAHDERSTAAHPRTVVGKGHALTPAQRGGMAKAEVKRRACAGLRCPVCGGREVHLTSPPTCASCRYAKRGRVEMQLMDAQPNDLG